MPVLNLVDNPGFAVGLEHEIAGTIRKGGEWMVAFAQVAVPIFTVLMRRSFGVAGNNQATPTRQPHRAGRRGRRPTSAASRPRAASRRPTSASWPRPPTRSRCAPSSNARIESVRGPIGPLNRFQIEEMIDPRDTRRYVCEWVEPACQLVRQPGRLTGRPGGFRP